VQKLMKTHTVSDGQHAQCYLSVAKRPKDSTGHVDVSDVQTVHKFAG